MPLLLIFFFSSFSILASSHIFALNFFLYWRYLWLDIPMHFLGGVTVALGIAILPFLRVQYFEKYAPYKTYVLLVLCVALLWEIFEMSIGIPTHEEGFFFDMILDVVMGVLGGVVGCAIVQSIKKI
jgi:hypothetical protein